MFSSYRDLLSLPGAWQFSAAAAVGRANIAMDGLGIVLLVQHETGSYARAGLVSGAFGLATALAAPLVARRADGHGQGSVVRTVSVIRVAAMTLLVLGVVRGVPLPVQLMTAIGLGSASTVLGSMVRSRWTHLLRDRPQQLRSAFSWESVLDEVVFINGPLVVTILATRVSPVVALVVAVILAVAGSWWFGSQSATEPPSIVVVRADRVSMWRTRTVVGLIAAFAMLGCLFGAIEVATVAFSREHGHPALAGAVLAAFSVTSMSAGLLFGARTWPGSIRQHFAVAFTALMVGMLVVPHARTMTALTLVLALTGFAIAPTLISGTQLAQALAPAGRTTEALTWTGTGITLGAATGAAVAGRVIDSSGGAAAFHVSAVAAVLGVCLAVGMLRGRVDPPSSAEVVSG